MKTNYLQPRPFSADVPETGSSGQDLLPLSVFSHHRPAVLLTQEALQLWVNTVLMVTKPVEGEKVWCENDYTTYYQLFFFFLLPNHEDNLKMSA